jgi:hypothetical protein
VALPQQARGAPFVRRPEQGGHGVEGAPVDLFRHVRVRAAQPGLQVRDRERELAGGESGGEAAVHVAGDHHRSRAPRRPDRARRLHRAPDQRGVAAAAAARDAEGDLRRGQAEIGEMRAEHRLVVVLAGVQKHRTQGEIGGQRVPKRRELGQVRPRRGDQVQLRAVGRHAKAGAARRTAAPSTTAQNRAASSRRSHRRTACARAAAPRAARRAGEAASEAKILGERGGVAGRRGDAARPFGQEARGAAVGRRRHGQACGEVIHQLVGRRPLREFRHRREAVDADLAARQERGQAGLRQRGEERHVAEPGRGGFGHQARLLGPFAHQQEAKLRAFRPEQERRAQQQVEPVGAAVRAGVDRDRFVRASGFRPPGRDLGAEQVEVRAVRHHGHRGGGGAVRHRRFRHAFGQDHHGGGASARGVGETVHGEPQRRRAHAHGAGQFRPGVADLEHEGRAARGARRQGGQRDRKRRGGSDHDVPRPGQGEGRRARGEAREARPRAMRPWALPQGMANSTTRKLPIRPSPRPRRKAPASPVSAPA